MRAFGFSWVVAVLGLAAGTQRIAAQENKFLATDSFDKLHRVLKPQRGESRWMEIEWHLSVWEARQRAAAEGKHIFLLAGRGGGPRVGGWRAGRWGRVGVEVGT